VSYCSNIAIRCSVGSVFNSRAHYHLGNMLNVVNVKQFRCTLNFIQLATLAVMDTFLSGYKRKDRDNKDSSNKQNEASSCRETVCKEHK